VGSLLAIPSGSVRIPTGADAYARAGTELRAVRPAIDRGAERQGSHSACALLHELDVLNIRQCQFSSDIRN
jgi:hypothetical protein